MKKHLKRWLPFALALTLLLCLLPVGGLVFADDDRLVATPNGYVVVNAGGADYVVNDNQSNSLELGSLDFSAAPAGAKLAFWFDTTAIAYDTSKGDKNNYAFYLDVDTTSSSDWQSVGTGEAVQTRVMVRDGVMIEDAGQIEGEEPSWIFTLPANTVGYMIIAMNNFAVNELEGFRLRPEWNWNDNADNKTIKIRDIGYVAPVNTPDDSDDLLAPPNGYVVVNAGGADYVVNDNQSNSLELGSLDFSAAPAGAKLAFWFDTTAIAYDTSKGDKNNYAFYLDVDTTSSSDWQSVGTGEAVQTRVMVRDGVMIEDAGQIEGEEPSWIFTLPANTVGYMIIAMNNFAVNELEGFRLRPEWNWNDNADNKTIKIRDIGYVAPVNTPDDSDDLLAPPEGFVLLDKDGMDHVVDVVADGGNRSSAYLHDVSAPEAPVGSKLVFYFDTTTVPCDSSLGDKDNWAVYIDVLPADAADESDANWETLDFPADGSAITRIICRDGQVLTVEGRDGDPSFLFAVPTGATGYMIIDMGQLDLNTIQAVRLRPEWNWNPNLYGQTIKIRNIGYIPGDGTKPEVPDEPDEPVVNPDDFPFIPEPSGTPAYYGTNYVVTNPDLQELKIDDSMKNDLVIDLTSNANAPEGAKAIVFRYNTTGIPETRSDYTDRGTHASYWSLIVDDVAISGNIDGAGDYKYVQHNQVYYWRDQVMENSGYLEWINTLPVNGIGYVIINIDDLQAYAQKFLGKSITVADVDSILMKQEWFWNVDMYNQTIRITDVGYLMDPAAFIASYKDSYVADYLKGPMASGSDIVAKADSVEGTFAELSWNEYKDANRYFINVYDEDGNYLLTERTRKTSLTLEGLDVSTSYKIQILATGDEDAILSVSNVLEITTLEENLEAYMKDVLEYDPTMTATGVELSGDKATIKWDWITGVGYYTVHLYEKDGDTLTFVSRTVAEDGVGEVTVSGLEKGKTYVAQIVSYDVTDSIIYAYVPTDAFEAKDGVVGGDSSDKDNAGSDNPDTGVSTCVGVVALASLLAGGVTVVTRKRR